MRAFVHQQHRIAFESFIYKQISFRHLIALTETFPNRNPFNSNVIRFENGELNKQNETYSSHHQKIVTGQCAMCNVHLGYVVHVQTLIKVSVEFNHIKLVTM